MHVYPPVSRGSSPHTRGAHLGLDQPPGQAGIIPAYAGSTQRRLAPPRRRSDHPRIRGEHCRRRRARPNAGRIIPAYAGSTVAVTSAGPVVADHPRIRGEHEGGQAKGASVEGSSPHTRGALARRRPAGRSGRIIPAYAGSTRRWESGRFALPDHPRIRGEHFQRCGERVDGVGSSPHTRGAHVHGTPYPTLGGIIPAYAGSTLLQSQPSPRRKDHPRIRGEHHACHLLFVSLTGSSPHTRGAQKSREILHQIRRIIPAYAGSTSSAA